MATSAGQRLSVPLARDQALRVSSRTTVPAARAGGARFSCVCRAGSRSGLRMGRAPPPKGQAEYSPNRRDLMLGVTLGLASVLQPPALADEAAAPDSPAAPPTKEGSAGAGAEGGQSKAGKAPAEAGTDAPPKADKKKEEGKQPGAGGGSSGGEEAKNAPAPKPAADKPAPEVKRNAGGDKPASKKPADQPADADAGAPPADGEKKKDKKDKPAAKKPSDQPADADAGATPADGEKKKDKSADAGAAPVDGEKKKDKSADAGAAPADGEKKKDKRPSLFRNQEIIKELKAKEDALVEKTRQLYEQEQSIEVLQDELELERKVNDLLRKQRDKAIEESKLIAGLCGQTFLP